MIKLGLRVSLGIIIVKYNTRFIMNGVYRENGAKKKVDVNTKLDVVLKVNGKMYNEVYVNLRHTDKNVLSAMLKYMDNDLNTIQVSGDTLVALMGYTGYQMQTTRDSVVRLQKCKLVEGTGLRGEYIVNPLFAVKGNEDKIWEHYKKLNEIKGLEC